ncbi:MAG: cytochrome c oxidase subunit 4 [Micrococcales bacterium]|nr:cytochrome c oxidase subunit 4 [Micrococcales bacterium]
MRVNVNLFTVLFVFFLVADFAYILWAYIDSGGQRIEWVGAIGIGLSAILAFFLQFYLRLTQRSIGGPLPEDRVDADIDDGDAEQGHFSPWSWWPFLLGISLALIFLGVAVGIWIALIGAPLVLIAVIGWNYEYYRGNFAR